MWPLLVCCSVPGREHASPSPGAWGPLCNWLGRLRFWNTAHVSSARVVASLCSLSEGLLTPFISAMWTLSGLPQEPGPASHFGGWPSPSGGETARFFPPVPLILTKAQVHTPLSQMAPLRLHSPLPGGAPGWKCCIRQPLRPCPFSGQDAFSRDGRWGPILVIVTEGK